MTVTGQNDTTLFGSFVDDSRIIVVAVIHCVEPEHAQPPRQAAEAPGRRRDGDLESTDSGETIIEMKSALCPTLPEKQAGRCYMNQRRLHDVRRARNLKPLSIHSRRDRKAEPGVE